MDFGSNLYAARRKSGLSQEAVAEKLGVSRQTVSKWELGETLPDVRQAKRMAQLYRMTLDELVTVEPEVQEIQRLILETDDRIQDKIDWTRAWGKRYPILLRYQQEVDAERYAVRLAAMTEELRREQGYSELDAFLVLKDILARVWKAKTAKK